MILGIWIKCDTSLIGVLQLISSVVVRIVTFLIHLLVLVCIMPGILVDTWIVLNLVVPVDVLVHMS